MTSTSIEKAIKSLPQSNILTFQINSTPTVNTPEQIHLNIQGSMVYTSYQTSIRHKANTRNLDKYYINKYDWEPNIIHLIYWNAHCKAIASLTNQTFETTTQLIHKWLPLHAAPFQNRQSTARLCPFCTSCDKTHHPYLN
jgi:hypothetical protein